MGYVRIAMRCPADRAACTGMSNWEIPPADPSEVYLKRVRELEPEAYRRIKTSMSSRRSS